MYHALRLEIYNSGWYSLSSTCDACVSSPDVKLKAYLENHSTDPNDRQAGAARQGRSKLVSQSALNSPQPECIPLTEAPPQPLVTVKRPHVAFTVRQTAGKNNVLGGQVGEKSRFVMIMYLKPKTKHYA